MTIAVVLSQPLRQAEAGDFLRSRELERTLVFTRFVNTLDPAKFPGGAEFLSWSPEPKPSPSSRLLIALAQVKRWIRSGSGIGHRIDRWAHSAEWRMRYIDRAAAVVEARKASRWDLANPPLVQLLESELSAESSPEIVVFDVFDLPAVLRYADERSCRVTVR